MQAQLSPKVFVDLLYVLTVFIDLISPLTKLSFNQIIQVIVRNKGLLLNLYSGSEAKGFASVFIV